MAAQAFIDRPYLKSPGFWATAARAYAFPASIVPVVLGAVYALYACGRFNWLLFLLALVAGMLYHTACNLINDYYDYKHGIDREGTYGGSGVLVKRQLTSREAMQVAVGCLIAGTLIGLYLIYALYAQYGIHAAAWMAGIGFIGMLAAVFYTATPGSAKYNALGEPLVFLMFGPGYVLGAYLLQTGQVSWNAVWMSIPVGFIVTAILQANDTRDLADDRESQMKIKTASIIFGATGARRFLSLLYFAPYIAVPLLVVLGIAPWPALIALATLPLALRLHKLFWTVRDEKSEKLLGSVENTAKLHMAFGMLLSLGVLIGYWIH
jgi:1,4-dihydroxy-2-naphthoate polyprenyltransferase